MGIKRILLLKKKWIDLIFGGSKQVELRSHNCNIRETIGLAASGVLYGKVTLTDSFQVDQEWKDKNVHLHQCTEPEMLKKYNCAWVFENAQPINPNLSFHQPQGAMMWVKVGKVDSASSRSSSFLGSQVILRTQTLCIEKILNGQNTSILVTPSQLENECADLWLGDNQFEIVWGAVTLGAPKPLPSNVEKCRALNLTNMRSNALSGDVVMREITSATPFPRTCGSGEPLAVSKNCGAHSFHKICKEDYIRNTLRKQTLGRKELPGIDLEQAACHYIEALTPFYLDRLRQVCNALHGSTVRLATTCSGMESVPGVAKALFRTGFHTYVHADNTHINESLPPNTKHPPPPYY